MKKKIRFILLLFLSNICTAQDELNTQNIAPLVSQTNMVLSCTSGTWLNASTPFIYQWQLNGVDIPDASNATFNISNLLPGNSVRCKISVSNNSGTTSAYSNTIFTGNAEINIVLSPSDSKILVQWTPVINASAYKVQYRIQGVTTWNNYTTQNPIQRGYEINGLINGNQYEIQVSAIINGSNSIPSAIKLSSPTINPTALIYNQILVSGQSLSLGIGGGVSLTATQPYYNRMLDLPSTVNNILNDGGAVLESDYTALIPLKEPNRGIFNNNYETPSSAMANMISTLSAPNSFNSILSLHGIGGRKYTELKKGGTLTSYENGQSQSKSAMKFSLMESKGYKILATAIIHGERDQATNTPITTYEANLVEWQSDYEQDAKQLTGQSENVPMFINQNSSWTGYNFTTPTIAIAQLNAIRNNPNKIFMTTPYYIFDYVDHAHIKNWGYRRSGEYFGKVMKKVLIDNVDWKPVMPTQVVRAGNIIEARFHVPVAPLVFDTNAVVAKSNYGFEYFDATNSATISNVEIVGGDLVRITLNQIPTGNSQKLRYAYTGVAGVKGARLASAPSGNLRDSDTTPALYNDSNVPSWAGTTLPNWSVTFNDVIISAPSKPQNVSGVVSSGQITLSWVAPSFDGGSSITDYIIEYKTSLSNTWTVLNDGISNATNATISGTTLGTNYNIRISAVNSSLVKGLIEIINL